MHAAQLYRHHHAGDALPSFFLRGRSHNLPSRPFLFRRFLLLERTAIFKVGPGENDGPRGTLFSIGVNRVVTLGNSTLHGEMVAIQMAQKKLDAFSLRECGAEYHLYTSCEPCCMCLGSALWSGVSKIACAATKDDAEAIGFNEGPVFPESYEALESAGCRVVRNVLREEGAAVLNRYGNVGVIYNADAGR